MRACRCGKTRGPRSLWLETEDEASTAACSGHRDTRGHPGRSRTGPHGGLRRAPLTLSVGATVLLAILPEPSSSPTLVFEFLPELCLMVSHQLETAATDAEWDDYVAAMAGPARSGRFRSIVSTEGAHPSRAQQARMAALVKGQPGRVAVLSSAGGVRFAVSLFALINRDVKSYSPKEYEAAFIHLDLPLLERTGVAAVIERLREKLAPPEIVTARRGRPECPPTTKRRSHSR